MHARYALLGGGFLRQRCRVAVCWQVVECLPVNDGWSRGHRRLVWDVGWSLSRWVGRELMRHMRHMRHMRRVRHSGGRMVVGRERVVRSLAHHVVSPVAIRRLAHGWTSLVSRIIHVRRRELRTALLRWHIAIVWSRGWWHRRHAIARYEGLRFWVEGVPVEAARDRMLALRIMGISIRRKSSICIRNSCMCHRTGPRLVRALVEAGRRLLPTMLRLRLRLRLRWRRLHGGPVRTG